MYARALHKLANTVPPGYAFRIGVCRISSTNATVVRKAVLKHHWGRDKRRPHIHLEEHDGKEMFTFAAKIFPFYNQVGITRVGIMVVFPVKQKQRK